MVLDPWIVPWHVMLPSFAGGGVLMLVLGWVVGRWSLRRHIGDMLPEISRQKISDKNYTIRLLQDQVKELQVEIESKDAALRGTYSLVSESLMIGGTNVESEH